MTNQNSIERAYKWLANCYWTKLGREGYTPLHKAAETGKLNKVPKSILTQENLTKFDKDSLRTPLHYAAERGHLDQVPRELLTSENILLPNSHGETVLHFAACGHLDQLPKELLTPDIFSVQAHNGSTPIHWAGSHYIHTIPTSALTDKNLLTTYNSGQTNITTEECSVIGMLKAQGGLDHLLGLELGESCQKIAGQEWCDKNNRIKLAKRALTTPITESSDLDIF